MAQNLIMEVIVDGNVTSCRNTISPMVVLYYDIFVENKNDSRLTTLSNGIMNMMYYEVASGSATNEMFQDFQYDPYQ